MSHEQTHSPIKLLVCIDGSAYADNICADAAWVAKKLNAQIDLLHVLRRHSDYQASMPEHTGSIGLGARSDLLDKLTQVDEQRAQLDQQKGRLILEHGEALLRAAGIEHINMIHRRGSLVETIQELEPDYDMIFIGKRGEHADTQSAYLGANLEKTARAIHKPLFVVSTIRRDMQRYLIAYDGKESVSKAIDFISKSPLLKDMEGHLLAVDDKTAIDTSTAEAALSAADLSVKITHIKAAHPDEAITNYVQENAIDILITGAYSHSRMRSLFLGSTTASLIKSCKVPLLLFR